MQDTGKEMTYYQRMKLKKQQEQKTSYTPEPISPISLDADTVHMWANTLGDRMPMFRDASTYIRSRHIKQATITWTEDDSVTIKHDGTLKEFKQHELLK